MRRRIWGNPEPQGALAPCKGPMACIRCGACFAGSFSGECHKCEAAVLREWVATEECKSEIKTIRPPMTHGKRLNSGAMDATPVTQKEKP